MSLEAGSWDPRSYLSRDCVTSFHRGSVFHITPCPSLQLVSFNSATGSSVNVVLPSEVTTVSSNLQKQWSYFAYAMTAVTFLFVVLILWVRKTVAIAIQIVKEASGVLMRQALACSPSYWSVPVQCCSIYKYKLQLVVAAVVMLAVLPTSTCSFRDVGSRAGELVAHVAAVLMLAVALKSMWSLLLFPMVSMVLVVGLYIYWLFVAAYMASTGDNVSNSGIVAAAKVCSV